MEVNNKIMLFGSSTVYGVPEQLKAALADYASNGWKFIMSDGKGADEVLNREVSILGIGGSAEVYCLDRERINKYGLKTRMFKSAYNENEKKVLLCDESGTVIHIIDDVEKESDINSNFEYNSFIDKYMVDECAFAFCIWDGKSKRELSTIHKLQAKGKQCYTMIVEV